jgi:hypothetical protein
MNATTMAAILRGRSNSASWRKCPDYPRSGVQKGRLDSSNLCSACQWRSCWRFELGIRSQIRWLPGAGHQERGHVRLMSRNKNDLAARFPILTRALANLPANIVDHGPRHPPLAAGRGGRFRPADGSITRWRITALPATPCRCLAALRLYATRCPSNLD